MQGVATAAEVLAVGSTPAGVIHHRINVGLRGLAGLLHAGLAIGTGGLHVAVQSSGAGVDKVHDTVGSVALHGVAGHALDGLGGPVGTDVGEAGSLPRQLVQKKHANAVHGIVLRSEGNSLTRAVPVEGAVDNRLRHIAVRVEIRPVTLTLEATANGVETEPLLLTIDGLEVGVTVHHVAEDDGHQDALTQRALLLLRGKHEVGAIAIRADVDIALGPGKSQLQLLLVVDLLLHAALHLGHVHRLHAHAQVVLPEGLVHDGTADAHGATTDGEVALALEGCHGDTGAGKAQDLLCNILGNGGVILVLHLVTVDGERGHTLLRIGSQGGSEIHGAGALRAVEAPDSLGRAVVGLEGLRDVAPARGNNQRATHIVLRELLIGGGGLGRATDAGVGNNTLDGLTVGMLHVRLDEGGGSLGHIHGLILQRLTNAEAAAVNRRANPDGR